MLLRLSQTLGSRACVRGGTSARVGALVHAARCHGQLHGRAAVGLNCRLLSTDSEQPTYTVHRTLVSPAGGEEKDNGGLSEAEFKKLSKWGKLKHTFKVTRTRPRPELHRPLT